jgi:hypothetical protein
MEKQIPGMFSFFQIKFLPITATPNPGFNYA